MAGGKGLGLEHVEGGPPDRPRAQRVNEGPLLDDRAPADVDEHARRLHRADLALADEAARLRGERRGDDDVVGERHQVGEPLRREHLVGSGIARRLAGAPAQAPHAHAQRPRARRDRAADVTVADDPHPAPLDHLRRERVPLPRPLALDQAPEVLREIKDRPDHPLGERRAEDAAAVRDRDSALGEPGEDDTLDARGPGVDPAGRRRLGEHGVQQLATHRADEDRVGGRMPVEGLRRVAHDQAHPRRHALELLQARIAGASQDPECAGHEPRILHRSRTPSRTHDRTASFRARDPERPQAAASVIGRGS